MMASDPVQPIVFGNLGKKRQGQRAGNDKINFRDKTRVTEKIWYFRKTKLRSLSIFLVFHSVINMSNLGDLYHRKKILKNFCNFISQEQNIKILSDCLYLTFLCKFYPWNEKYDHNQNVIWIAIFSTNHHE